MAGWPEGSFVSVAAWVAGIAAGCLVTRLAAGRRGIAAMVAVAVVAVGAGSVALATGGDRPRPPVSLDWPVAHGSVASVVVVPGDSLWRIAARALLHPTAARVSVAWPRWWHTNRRLIGADPNLIHPGQRLRPPARPPRRRR